MSEPTSSGQQGPDRTDGQTPVPPYGGATAGGSTAGGSTPGTSSEGSTSSIPPYPGSASSDPYAQQPYGEQQPYGQQQPYSQQPYAQQPYPGGYPSGGYGYGAAAPATNTLAIVSLVASVLGFVALPVIGSIVGVITGHMARRQIAERGEQGAGMATAGLIVGYVGLALLVLFVIVMIVIFAAAGTASFSTT